VSSNNAALKGEAPGNLTIGEGVKVVGHLTVPGLAVINGTLEGGLQASELLVGPQGTLSGQVSVRVADIHGATYETLVASEFLCVRSTGVVNGQAHYGEIEIEKGGVIQGVIAPSSQADEAVEPAATAAKAPKLPASA
jgi:cytoskeletal protein CcmA (bactofilin family)